ncbi:MAG: DUF2087 domain-containing protein [Butyrivibrio sp.]|nr:DUF2087 domain-containing protein [Butyrivibrio sp.]
MRGNRINFMYKGNEFYREKIKVYYDKEGLLTQYPSKKPMRILALAEIAVKLDTSRKYTEKEINEIIKSSVAFTDIELIRREMFQYKFIGRLKDGSQYWAEQDWRERYGEYFQKHIHLRLYSEQSEKICFTFNPLKMSAQPDWNPQWEEWHCYPEPLVVYIQDYEILLQKYFDMAYPTVDAFDGTAAERFDVCFDNWLGTKDWRIIVSGIENDLENQPPDRKEFYSDFLSWIKKVLEYSEIIVVEGNL